MTTILVVEDEAAIAAALRELLEREGYVVETAATLAAARQRLLPYLRPRESWSTPRGLDALLLDWRLPDGEGIDLLKELRRTSALPVLMVTARVEIIDRVLGLEIGADDYVTKPVEPRELLARLRARLRTHRAAEPAGKRVLEHAGVAIDLDTREVTFEGRAVPTTRMEFGLLALLVEHAGRVFSREELLNQVWGYERTPTTRTVDTHVVQLRTKLRADLIESVRGIGYRLVRKT
jgi:DNA-binding response OmpR family regulator